MRISDWSSDVCSSDLQRVEAVRGILFAGSLPVCTHHDTLWGAENFQAVVGSAEKHIKVEFHVSEIDLKLGSLFAPRRKDHAAIDRNPRLPEAQFAFLADVTVHLLALHRSEEHTSELQSLMRRSYAVFCLK